MLKRSLLTAPLILTTLVAGVVTCPTPAEAQTGIVREAIERLIRISARTLGREAAEETAERIVRECGEEAAERVLRQVIREGGEEALERVGRLAAAHGSDVVRALDNVPQKRVLLEAIEDLAPHEVEPAVRRLAVRSTAEELSDAIARHGARAIRAELKHPGVAGRLIKTLGDDGLRIAERVTTEQAIALARYADEIAAIPQPQKKRVIELILERLDAFARYCGEFAKQNPGKTLFTGAFVTVLLANPDAILGGEYVIQTPGAPEPRVVRRPGLLGTVLDTAGNFLLTPIVRVLAPIVAVFTGLWLSLQLWKTWQLCRIRIAHERQRAEQSSESKPQST